MNRRRVMRSMLAAALAAIPGQALATQAHGAPEGIIAHQLAHIFFIVSMGVLIFWLRERDLVRQAGWRYIQYAALFLAIWNVDTFTVHLLDEQLALVTVERLGVWRIRISTAVGTPWLGRLYYLAKLDHLLCVPALLFLYIGLKKLRGQKELRTPGVDPS
jgi:hypothetical protein